MHAQARGHGWLPRAGVFLGVFLFALLRGRGVEAAVRVSLAFDGIYSRPLALNTENRYVGKWGNGGGLLLELPLFTWLGFELGGFYLMRQFSDSLNGVITSRTAEAPAGLRIWFGRWLSIGGGVYGAYGIDRLTAVSGNSSTYSDYGITNLDYGYHGNVRISLPVGKSFAFFSEGRATYSAVSVAKAPEVSIRYTDAQVLLGISIGGGKRR